MVDSKLAHFSLVLSADGAVRGVVRFASPERAQAAAKALGYGKVRAAQLSVGGELLLALYDSLPGSDDSLDGPDPLWRAIAAYEKTLPQHVGDTVDKELRAFAIKQMTEAYEAALRRAGA